MPAASMPQASNGRGSQPTQPCCRQTSVPGKSQTKAMNCQVASLSYGVSCTHTKRKYGHLCNLCGSMPSHAAPCCPMLSHAAPCPLMLSHAVSCCPMPSHAVPCCLMLPHGLSCCPMPAHARPCYPSCTMAHLQAVLVHQALPHLALVCHDLQSGWQCRSISTNANGPPHLRQQQVQWRFGVHPPLPMPAYHPPLPQSTMPPNPPARMPAQVTLMAASPASAAGAPVARSPCQTRRQWPDTCPSSGSSRRWKC